MLSLNIQVQSSAMRLRMRFASVLVVMLLVAACAQAEPVASLKPTDCVNDFAGVLSPAITTQLKELCRQILDKAQASLVVVTVKSTDGQDIFDYSVDLYQKWGIGQKGKDRGVLILLAVQDRKRSIRVGYGLEGILPDGKVGGFGREAVPYLQRGDYDGAVSLLTSRVADVIAQDAGVQLTTSQPRRIEPLASPPQAHDDGLSPGAIVGLIILIIIVLAVPPLRRLLFYMFLFGGGGRGGGYGGYGGGGWGGGGFGGGGGGGGFGGFGGGSTGGGGADGSW